MSSYQAEYTALNFGLHMARFFEIDELLVYGDSKYMIDQMNVENLTCLRYY